MLDSVSSREAQPRSRRRAPRQTRRERRRRSLARGIGKALIATGLIVLLFVAYQLWGTGLAEARSQRQLKRQLAQVLASTTTISASPGAEPPAAAPAPPAPIEGSAMAMLRIPRIGLEKAVVEGVSVGDLKKGPGHYPTTPMPGQAGNAAIAGHRTTYGAPFGRLNELELGDPILITTRQGKFEYRVSEQLIVRPSDNYVLAPTEDNRLTLTTCHPKYSAAKRLIVVARLAREVATRDAPLVTPTTMPAPLQTSPPSIDAPASTSGERSDRLPATLWALATASVWALAWMLGRLWRRWPAYVVGVPVFLVALFRFFESVSRLLPANF